jgi:two-component system, OmpR family, alkaline phosphatase synthesis response regulator PhoP
MAKKKILIIEDEATLHKSLADFLEAEDFEVAGAFDGEKGVEMAKSGQPDLILLDIVLPKKDGYEVLDDLKKDENTKKIPIILLTNLESTENIQKAFEKGINTYLVKSDYKLEDISRKIKETLKV